MGFHVAILAGGRSRRMGEDKALVRVAGVPMLERVARAAAGVIGGAAGGSRLLLVLGRETPPPGWPPEVVAEWMPDSTGPAEAGGTAGGRGPMPALIGALTQTGRPILLLACDTPLLTADTLGLLVAAHKADPTALATMATCQTEGQVYGEPTLALYTPGLLPALRNLLHHQKGSFQPLLGHPQVRAWPVPPERQGELLNVNDVAGVAEAERRIVEAQG
jgi:molybdopterin-guanine dinucleotide biosynthesis protein A